MITFQVERFADSYHEARPLLDAHWAEVALNQDLIKLEPDIGLYLQIEQQGGLHIVVCRRDGRLVGYHCSFVKPHIHYLGSLTAFVDIYYLHPDLRAMPRVAYRLFQTVHRTLHSRGVQRIITPTKIHLDKTPFLQSLGYREIERVHELIL